MRLVQIGLIGGAGTRAAMGIRDLMQDRQPVGASGGLPRPVQLLEPPRRNRPAAGAGAAAMQPLEKVGGDPAVPAPAAPAATASPGTQPASQGPWTRLMDRIANTIAPRLPKTHTTNPLMNEWGIPLGLAATGGSLYGGYKAVDWLLGKEQDMAGRRELDDARDDYRSTLADQYRAAMLSKQAGDDLGIDSLFDARAQLPEKQASMSLVKLVAPKLDEFYANNWPLPGIVGYDNWEAMKGAGNAAMLATLVGTGKLVYDSTKKGTRQELLQKALKQRQMQRTQGASSPLVINLGDEGGDRVSTTI